MNAPIAFEFVGLLLGNFAAELEEDKVSRRRGVEITTASGDWWETEMNGTKEEIRAYFMGKRFEGWDGEKEVMGAPVILVEFTS